VLNLKIFMNKIFLLAKKFNESKFGKWANNNPVTYLILLFGGIIMITILSMLISAWLSPNTKKDCYYEVDTSHYITKDGQYVKVPSSAKLLRDECK